MSPRRIAFLFAFLPLLVPSLAFGIINFIQNPGFATDLSSWTVPTYTTGAWSPKNRSGSGGSALLTSAATNAASAPDAAIQQCVAASPGHVYTFGASLWVPGDLAPTAPVSALLDVRFYSDTSCASPQLDQVVVQASPVLRDSWIDVQGHQTAPAGTQSALVAFAAVDFTGSSTAETIQVYVDDAFFYSDANCATTADRLCLGGRFLVYGDWAAPSQAQQGYMHALPVTGDSGLFWFFSPDNLEIFAKVLNACGPALNNHFWVFASGLTNVQVHMHVDDTVSGETREYDNAAGTAFAPVQDTSAFATCP
jgi:hypothetical protein